MDNSKKYLLLASDERSYLDLFNISKELNRQNKPFCFLYSLTQERSFQINSFSLKNNYSNEKYFIKELNIALPFDPDVVIMSNENWDPEKSLIGLFKKLGKYVACVETSSYLSLGLSSKLEIFSRKSYPTNCADVFFDHSEWSKKNKEICGWYKHKSVVTGNPKYDDINSKPNKTSKKIIILGLKEPNHRKYLMSNIDTVINKFPDHEILYKPHPVEHLDFPKDFDSDYLKTFNLKLIKSQSSLMDHIYDCELVVSMLQSILYYALALNKKVILIDNPNIKNISIDGFTEEMTEERFSFWQGILNIKNFKHFQEMIGFDCVCEMNQRNNELRENFISNCLTLKNLNKSYNNKNLLHYFNYKQKNKASQTIINFIENEFKK